MYDYLDWSRPIRARKTRDDLPSVCAGVTLQCFIDQWLDENWLWTSHPIAFAQFPAASSAEDSCVQICDGSDFGAPFLEKEPYVT